MTIRPLDERVSISDVHTFGRYNAIRREIALLPFAVATAASAERQPAFGVPLTRDLWRSYIAHESAHAVVDPYFASGVPHVAAGEYVAGVVQLMVLTDATREAILENNRSVSGWGCASEITSLFYFMAPAAFAIKSYRHFIALPPVEQSRFIGRLVREGLGE